MTLRNAWLPFVLLLAVDAAPAAAADPDVLPRLIAQARKAEAVEMFTAIMSGDPPNAGFGWFHPSQSVYGWKWLAKQHGKSAEEGITKAEFHGPAALFERLDRDHDGVISAADFDWSDRSPWMRQFYTASSWFRRAESDANGRITPEKWQALYKQIARDKDAMTPEDLQTWLFPPPRQGPPPANSGMPSRATLLLGLFGSEIGSPCEGPAVGRPAPNFTLQTLKGEEYSLNQFKGVKPVVLVFGNFSCGPFRSQSGSVEDLKRRYGDRFEFLGVYVRDAHPTTGWRMAANDRVGIAYEQPGTDEERVKVAVKCSAALELTMPLLVDQINDRVGHTYSGMPDRLYLIGRDGVVRYKSGRGPFGFIPRELEQSMILYLLDQTTAAARK